MARFCRYGPPLEPDGIASELQGSLSTGKGRYRMERSRRQLRDRVGDWLMSRGCGTGCQTFALYAKRSHTASGRTAGSERAKIDLPIAVMARPFRAEVVGRGGRELEIKQPLGLAPREATRGLDVCVTA